MTNTATKTAEISAKAATPKAPAKGRAPKAPAGKAPAAPKAAKPKVAADLHKPLAKADQVAVARLKGSRAYKPLTSIGKVAARPGSWRYAMIAAALGNKDTDKAKAAVPAEFAGKAIDFAFLAANRYIEFTA